MGEIPKNMVTRPERIGFLDIETTNLVADFGIMLTWCIKDQRGGVAYDMLTLKDLRKAKAGDEDKRIVRSLIKEMLKYDRIVTYYGKRFDVPFIRTRAVAMGVAFPDAEFDILHTDCYDLVRRRFRLSSNRLENANRTLIGRTDKTRIDAKFWRGASRGDKRSLREVLKHNKFDVLDLQKLYERVQPYSKRIKSRL